MAGRLTKVVGIVAACLVSAGTGFAVYRLSAGDDGVATQGEIAPEIRLPALEGGERALSEWRGQLVLVNFWATWCTPCIKEIPLLVDVQTRFGGRGLQVLGPALDDLEAVRLAVPRLGINYPVMIGDTPVTQAMDALGDRLGALPYSVLIARDGRVLYSRHGEFSREELEELLLEHLR